MLSARGELIQRRRMLREQASGRSLASWRGAHRSDETGPAAPPAAVAAVAVAPAERSGSGGGGMRVARVDEIVPTKKAWEVSPGARTARSAATADTGRPRADAGMLALQQQAGGQSSPEGDSDDDGGGDNVERETVGGASRASSVVGSMDAAHVMAANAELVALRLQTRRYISRAQCAEEACATLRKQVGIVASGLPVGQD
jgi:hypothetical protein